MESSSLVVWLKSLVNVVISNSSADCSNYATLQSDIEGSDQEKTTTLRMENSDSNNNSRQVGALKNGHLANGHLSNGAVLNTTKSTSIEQPDSSSSDTTSVSKHIPPPSSSSASTGESEDVDQHSVASTSTAVANAATTEVPCCDMIKYKNEVCQNLQRSSSPLQLPPDAELKSGQTFKSTKIIEAIIDVIRNRQVFRRFDPLVTHRSRNFNISPLVTVCIRNCQITGFTNIEKADSEGNIRYLGSNRFSIDCAINLRHLHCEAHYSIKLGHRWHRRACLRNKSLTMKLDKCLVYVEVKINTTTKTIRFEKFTPISQENIRCKTKPFSMNSLNAVFGAMLQRYFEQFLAVNVHRVESQARRYLDRSQLLQYEDVVSNTALQKLFECFPGVVPPSVVV